LIDDALLLGFFLLDSLDFNDVFVELDQQRRQLRIDFVDNIAIILFGLVVDILKKHHRREILFETVNFFGWERMRQQFNQFFALAGLDGFEKQHNLLFDLDDLLDLAFLLDAP